MVDCCAVAILFWRADGSAPILVDWTDRQLLRLALDVAETGLDTA